MFNIIIIMYSQQFCKDASFVLGDRNFILDRKKIFLFHQDVRSRWIPAECKSIKWKQNTTASSLLKTHKERHPVTSFAPLLSVSNRESRTIICLPDIPSSGTLCSSLPGRQLNGTLERDCAVLVFLLKSYLTREHSILMLLSSGNLQKLCIINVA
jgi:hypothetical protein